MYESVLVCAFLVCPSHAIKDLGGCRRAPPLAHRQELVSPINYDFPTSKEGQVVLFQSGRKEEEEEERGSTERERGSEASAAICGNKREFLI